MGVIEVFSSRPSTFCATHVAELEQVANSLAADPSILRMANLAGPASAARSLPSAEPTVRRSTLVFPEAKVSSTAGGQTGSQPVLTPRPTQVVPLNGGGSRAICTTASARRDSRCADIDHESESASSDADKRTAARAWLAGVAALFFLAFLSWFGLFRPRAIKTSSGFAVPAAPGGGRQVNATPQTPVNAPGLESSDYSRLPLSPASKAEEEKSSPKLGAVPVEDGNSLATSLSSPSGPQLNPQPAGGTAAIPRDANPTGALSSDARTGSPAPPAPTREATILQPVAPPEESSNAAIPAVIPPINLPLNPPTPIRSAIVSSPDFVLDLTPLKAIRAGLLALRSVPTVAWLRAVGTRPSSFGMYLPDRMKGVQAVALSRDGHWLAAENSSDTVTLWDATTGQETHTLTSNKSLGVLGSNWVYSIAFSPDGRWLASGVDDKTVRLWDVATGRIVRDLTGLRRTVMYASFSPDGRWLACGDDDKNIRIWDTSTGEEIRRLSGHKKAIYAVVFSPDGRWLASASGDKTVRLWDVATGRQIHTFAGHGNIVTSLAFSPEGRWLASGSWDKTIKIWDVETGVEVQTLVGHDHSIYSLAFDSTGRWIASGSEDGKINLWRSDQGAVTGQYESH